PPVLHIPVLHPLALYATLPFTTLFRSPAAAAARWPRRRGRSSGCRHRACGTGSGSPRGPPRRRTLGWVHAPARLLLRSGPVGASQDAERTGRDGSASIDRKSVV